MNHGFPSGYFSSSDINYNLIQLDVGCIDDPASLLSRLPASRIAPAVEAGDYHNPMLLNLEEYSVGEAPHPRTATTEVADRELQRMLRDCHHRGLDCQGETLPKLRANIVVPCPRFQQILISPRVSRRPGVSRFLK